MVCLDLYATIGFLLFIVSEGLALTPLQVNSVLQLIMRLLKVNEPSIPPRSDSL